MKAFTPPTPAQPAPVARWWYRPETLLFLLTLGLAGFLLVFDLGRTPIQLWDESRTAVNTAEMDHSGRWLTTEFDGLPDLWNTKPPLLIWLQVLSLRLFGYSEWALRLPTALAGLGTLSLLYWFAARALRRPWAGLFASLVLVTSAGFLRLHVARTADYDTLLTFWQVLVWTCFYYYLESRQRRYLIWTVLALTAAVFTKSIAGLLGVPALLLYTIFRGRLGWVLRQPLVYALALLSLGSIAAFVYLREQAAPGYWEAILFNDLGGRFLGLAPSNPTLINDLKQHEGPWHTYLQLVWEGHFWPWLLFLPLAGWLIWRSQEQEVRRVGLLAALFAGGWLAVISSSAAKLDWYDAPMYPALALLVGLGLALALEWVGRQFRLSPSRIRILYAAGLVLFFLLPYKARVNELIGQRHNAAEVAPDMRLGTYLRQLLHDEPQHQQLTVLYAGGYFAPLKWYYYAYQQRNVNLNLQPFSNAATLSPETIVVTSDPTYRPRLDSLFQTVTLHEGEYGQTLLLLPHHP